MALAFPRSVRLVESADFRRVREGGSAYHGRFFILSVLRVEEETESKVGFITSKRVGNAVKRNRVRRRLREIVRHALPSVKPGYFLVLIGRHSAAQAPFSALQEEWLRLAARASIVARSA